MKICKTMKAIIVLYNSIYCTLANANTKNGIKNNENGMRKCLIVDAEIIVAAIMEIQVVCHFLMLACGRQVSKCIEF